MGIRGRLYPQTPLALQAVDVAKAPARAVNAAMPTALREIHAEVMDLRRENQRLREELLETRRHIDLLRENLAHDRDQLEQAEAEGRPPGLRPAI